VRVPGMRFGLVVAAGALITCATGCSAGPSAGGSAGGDRPSVQAAPTAAIPAPTTPLSVPTSTSSAQMTSPTSSPSVTYRRYLNGRFQISAEIPAQFQAGHPPENGDGQIFRFGSARVSVYGNVNSFSETPAQALASAVQSAPGEITYQSQNGPVIAVSGQTTTGQVFYIRSVVRPGLIATLDWLYPAQDQAVHQPEVEHAVATFTVPP
jgi:hypothetical protein